MELVRGQELDGLPSRPIGPLDRDEIRFRIQLMILDLQCGPTRSPARRHPSRPQTLERHRVGSRRVVHLGNPRSQDSRLRPRAHHRIHIEASMSATDVGVIQGTLPYMSPEQALGLADQVDVRTDVYAGVMLYEMLTAVARTIAARLDLRSLCASFASSRRRHSRGRGAACGRPEPTCSPSFPGRSRRTRTVAYGSPRRWPTTFSVISTRRPTWRAHRAPSHQLASSPAQPPP